MPRGKGINQTWAVGSQKKQRIVTVSTKYVYYREDGFTRDMSCYEKQT